MISFEDFKKLELVTAKVVDVQLHPNADKLYVLKIAVGEEERQIVAGLREFYKPEELSGKTVVVVKNLATATIRGVDSNGMLLAARDGKDLSIITAEKPIKDGSKIS